MFVISCGYFSLLLANVAENLVISSGSSELIVCLCYQKKKMATTLTRKSLIIGKESNKVKSTQLKMLSNSFSCHPYIQLTLSL